MRSCSLKAFFSNSNKTSFPYQRLFKHSSPALKNQKGPVGVPALQRLENGSFPSYSSEHYSSLGQGPFKAPRVKRPKDFGAPTGNLLF